MNVLAQLRMAFQSALSGIVSDPESYLGMIRPSNDPKFGDYQANFAMAMAKTLGQDPVEVAQHVVARLDVSQFCHAPEIAGRGFINLRLKDEWIAEALSQALQDARLGITPTQTPQTYVVDYSSPNVAKPMHVGHIRSTVIGDALARVLRFLGHQVVTDNHLGDWGTQFGMIIYGYKNFLDATAYAQAPVTELARLYRLVRSLIDYHAAKRDLPGKQQAVEKLKETLEQAQQLASSSEKNVAKKGAADVKRINSRLEEAREAVKSAQAKISATESAKAQFALAQAHPEIDRAVLDETAALHAGNEENRKLWEEFLPYCREDIQRVYQRLDIQFDQELGESFYQPWLGEVVEGLKAKGLAKESEGAQCVFLPGFETPMLVRKSDGAFLYATTDLATIRFRMETWKPDAILYVVDHRQSEHFQKLFAAAKLWGYDSVDLRHVSFGTVMGEDGKPFKTRAGDTVGLEGLLDEAISRARSVVDENLAKNAELNFTESERQRISEVVGIGSLKYFDLSQNRTTDYKFSYDKMLALKGNTAPYLLYPYARVNGIFSKGGIDATSFRSSHPTINLAAPEERQLALALLRFENALQEVLVDYLPNLLANYLYELTTMFSQFYEKCKVLEAESDEARQTRLVLCDLLRRTLSQGLELLGIGVVERM